MPRPKRIPSIVPVLLICTLLLSLLLHQDAPGSATPSLLLSVSDPVTFLPWSALLVLLMLG